MEVADLIGYAAATASLVAFSARTMIPLRVAAIVRNVLFIAYGIAGTYGPPLVLHMTFAGNAGASRVGSASGAGAAG